MIRRLVVLSLLNSLVRSHEDFELERTELDVKLPKAISDHTAVLGSDNLIYIAGGCDSPDGNIFDANYSFFYCPSVSKSFYSFDPATQEFQVLPDLPRTRYRHASVAVQNHVFLVGGRDVEDNLIAEVDVSSIHIGSVGFTGATVDFELTHR
jgi:Kelch motif